MLVAACGFVPGVDGGATALMVVNGADAEAVLRLEQGGGVDDLPTQACSASSHHIEAGRTWTLEFRGDRILDSEDVPRFPESPVTFVEVRIDPNGRVAVSDARPVDEMPNVPITFQCSGGPRSDNPVATFAGTLERL